MFHMDIFMISKLHLVRHCHLNQHPPIYPHLKINKALKQNLFEINYYISRLAGGCRAIDIEKLPVIFHYILLLHLIGKNVLDTYGP